MDFKQAFDEISTLSEGLCKQCDSPESLIAVASNMTYQAATIYEHIGGPELVAQQFYALADKYAAKGK